MIIPNHTVTEQLRHLVSEEMFLLGQELDDSLTATERQRLSEVSALLDRASEVLADHRAIRPHR